MSVPMKRLGVIIPSPNTVAEIEIPHLLPSAVTAHFSRFKVEDAPRIEARLKDFSEARGRVVEAALQLKDAKPDVIALACVIGTLAVGNVESEDHLRSWTDPTAREIEARTGIRCIAAAEAMVKAVRLLEIRQCCLITPYVSSVSDGETRFLTRLVPGLRVIGRYDMGIVEGFPKALVPEMETLNILRKVCRTDCEGLVISCTNLRSLGIISAAEAEFGCPVVTSVQSLVWACLVEMGVGPDEHSLSSGGRLFKVFPAADV
jgi:maleate cis-trans isomerase